MLFWCPAFVFWGFAVFLKCAIAGTLYLDGFSNLAVRELSGYMPVLYIWPDDTSHVNVERVTDFHVFEFVED